MSEPTAVVFDLDDTLYAERRFALSGCAAVAAQLAAERGVPADAVYRFLARRCRAGARADMLQALCVEHGLPLVDVPRWVETIRTHEPRLRLPARAVAVLAELRQRGHRLGVLTNGLPDTQRRKVHALGVEAIVDAVVYAEECVPGGKPARECFIAALHRLGVDASAAVFVGDHPGKDVAGAAAAGLRAVWMARPGAPAPAEADLVARRITDVPALVARLLEERHVAPC